jgi:hypothetical protein
MVAGVVVELTVPNTAAVTACAGAGAGAGGGEAVGGGGAAAALGARLALGIGGGAGTPTDALGGTWSTKANGLEPIGECAAPLPGGSIRSARLVA